jgi:transcriptional regulator with XRE-family HTH domain
MLTGMALSDRIREILNDKRLTPAELSRASGLSKSLLSKYLAGGVENITLPKASKLAKATGYSAIWIANGNGIKKGSTVLSVLDGGKPDKAQRVNPDALERAISLVEQAALAERKVYPPPRKASIVLAVYDILVKGGNPDSGTVKNILRLVS